ncbi:MAG: alpha/beta hydrolase [Candidatus Helarchaeota archaeon]
MGKFSSAHLRQYFLIIGVVLILTGVVLAPYDQFKTDITPTKVSFTSRNDSLKITGNLYLPTNYTGAEAFPAVILVHGINDRAERYHHMAVEFVRRNFIALAINLRGHQDSQGYCTLSAYEPWDIMGAADFLLTNYNVSNLGLVGHSLGGMSAIRAAHNDTRFNATVVMGPPVSIDLLFQRYLTDITLLEDYLYLLSLHMDLTDPYERFIRSPVFWVNKTRPRNLFYVLGSLDTAATPEEALLIIANATGNSSVEVNVAYGDFSAGNRTMLKMYSGIDHGSEPTTPSIIRDTVLWVENALLGAPQGTLTEADLIQWSTNSYWGLFLQGGFLFCILPAISYICSFFIPPHTLHSSQSSKLSKKAKLLSLGMYTGIFIGASALTLPFMQLFGYANWSPYNIAGFVVNILTIQGCFLGIGLIAIFLLEKRKFNASVIDFGFNPRTWWKALIIGCLISFLLIFGIFYLPSLPTGLYSFPRDWGAYFLLFLNFLFVSLIGEIYLRGLIHTKFFKETSRLKSWFRLGLTTLLAGILQGIATFFIVLPLSDITITIGTFTLWLPLIGLIGGAIIFTGLGVINVWIFRKTQNILSSAIVQATLLSWFLTSFMVML